MIIRQLANFQHDVELRWLTGLVREGDQLKIRVQFLNHGNGTTFIQNLPFGMLPFLTPGLVVSNGEVRTERRTGKRMKTFLSNLTACEEIDVMEGIARSHYDLGGRKGGGQRLLRYRAGGRTILIPTFELIRLLFMHSKALATALLTPSGLMELAVTPAPGLYPDIDIDFTGAVPHRAVSPEFVKEFTWLAVHPDGRRAWDSVLTLSAGKPYLTLAPPPLRNCHLTCRGVVWNNRLLVLEILSLSGRKLPAGEVRWTHPLEILRIDRGSGSLTGPTDDGVPAEGSRPRREREHVVDGEADAKPGINQDVELLGGKRGCFDNHATVTRVQRQVPKSAAAGDGTSAEGVRKTRSDAGQAIDPGLRPTINRHVVSAGEPTLTGTAPSIDFSVLEHASRDHVGDLELLESILLRIEAAAPDLTLSQHLVFLQPGKAVSLCGIRRRACLVAVLTSPSRPPRVILDVDHTHLNGIAALLLRYSVVTPLAIVAEHVRQLLTTMVDNYGHWDRKAEIELSLFVDLKRLPKLIRMTERAADEAYMRAWVSRLLREIQ
jgi:hypothetical protein